MDGLEHELKQVYDTKSAGLCLNSLKLSMAPVCHDRS